MSGRDANVPQVNGWDEPYWRRANVAVTVWWHKCGWKCIACVASALAVFFAGVAAQQRVDVGRFLNVPTDPTGPNWADIAMVLLTAVLVFAGVRALGAVGEARRSRNAQQMTELLRRWDEESHREVRREVMEVARLGLPLLNRAAEPGPDLLKEVIIQLRDENSPKYRRLITDPGFLEDLAIMVYYRGIDFEIVNLSLGYTIPYRWSLWKPTAVALREAKAAPELYENFEKLAKKVAAANRGSVELDIDGEVLWRGFRD